MRPPLGSSCNSPVRDVRKRRFARCWIHLPFTRMPCPLPPPSMWRNGPFGSCSRHRRRKRVRPTAASTASADPLDRLLAAFFAGRSPHTVDAYTRDLEDFCAFVRRYTLTQERNPIGSASHNVMTSALRWYFEQTPGHANEIALNYRNDLLTRHKATATTARHLSVVKSLAKYARMTGMITWAVEIPVPRIERTRDTRGPSLETIQNMLTGAAAQPSPMGPRDVAL